MRGISNSHFPPSPSTYPLSSTHPKASSYHFIWAAFRMEYLKEERRKKMDNTGRFKKWSLLAIVGFAALLTAAPFHAALAATAPSLGSESTYGVVSSTFTNS